MNDQDAQILSYATNQPRSMRQKVVIAAATVSMVSALGAGIAVTIHRIIYRATKTQSTRLLGELVGTSVNWNAPNGQPTQVFQIENTSNSTPNDSTTGAVEIPSQPH